MQAQRFIDGAAGDGVVAEAAIEQVEVIAAVDAVIAGVADDGVGQRIVKPRPC